MHACVAQRLNGLLDARARLGYLPVSNSKDNIATLIFIHGGFIKLKPTLPPGDFARFAPVP